MFGGILLPLFYKLFDCVLNKGLASNSLSSSIIVPIFKKDGHSHPYNYRGIAWLVTFVNFPLQVSTIGP